MFGYYLDLALRSLRRTPILTGLMVLAIGLGIGASMTMITVLHMMTDDPMPGRSAHLYMPHLDPLPLKSNSVAFGHDASDNLTWPDAMALLDAHRAVRQAADLYGTPIPDGWRARFTVDPLYRRRLLARDGWGRQGYSFTRFGFYIRSHWLRMPPLMLARHLWTKATRKPA